MPGITAPHVHKVLSRYMVAEGLPFVCDLERSHGVWVHDARNGKEYLDLFSFYAALPLGFNHPKLRGKKFLEKLVRVSIQKPANPDAYTVELAEAVETFSKRAGRPGLPHLFFIDGGALAVENCLKAAFDWKVKKNFEKGLKEEKGHRVIHFRQAFHGRSGYTLSLTNTYDLRKTKFFPTFDWPRIENPKLRFPVTDEVLKETEAAEQRALKQIDDAFTRYPDDIAAIIIEPIQGEGGDNHFRAEFLRELRRIADEREAMLIFDEVQCGFAITGKMWAYANFGVEPDMLAFSKKTQVGGFMCGRRIEEVQDNVFAEPTRISSTWGANLTDFVRLAQILEIMFEEDTLTNVIKTGERLMAGMLELQKEFPALVTNARGRGLMCAFDLPSPDLRDQARVAVFEAGAIMLGCGQNALRFRPALNITLKEVDAAIDLVRKGLRAM
ncbi:MAG: L-lysine 6-transaminase [Deltaproteobacteria bacterium]|nr:L-lysine 6-transaminase [Deltaproteobacteria bacterium]